jgi:HEAT repeat protein
MLKKRFAYSLLLLGCLLFTMGQKAQADPSSEEAQRYQEAYNYILEEKWEKALEACKAFVQEFKGSSYVDDARFWHCYAMEKKGIEYEEVFRCYEDFIKTYPNSKWADDAKRNLIVIGKKLSDMGKKEYGAVIRTMQDSADREIALTAISALRNIGNERALDALVGLYKRTQHRAVREEIIFTLSQFRLPKAVQSLTEIVKEDPDRRMREKAIFWLGQMAPSDEMIQLLEHVALNDPHRDVRKKAVFGLSEAHDGKGVKPLIRIAEKAKNVDTRKDAVLWLSQKTQSEEAIQCLETIALNEANSDIAKKAVFGLSEAPEGIGIKPLIRIAETAKNADTREEAVFWVGQKIQSGETIKSLEAIALKDPHRDVREKAVFVLSEARDERGVKALIRIAQTAKDKDMRKRAISWLCHKTRSEEVIQCLETIALNDTDSDVARDAVFALSEAHEGRGVKPLIQVAQTAKDIDTRKRAIFWLGQKTRTEEAIKCLESIALNEANSDVAKKAVFALSEAPDGKGVKPLIRIAEKAKNVDTRKEAVSWVGRKTQSEETIKSLEAIALNDPHRDVREKAVFALSEVRGERGVKALIRIAQTAKDADMRKRAISWLGYKTRTEEAIQCLETIALNEANSDVAKRAVFALSEARDGRGIKALIRIAEKAKNVDTRKEAVFWVGQKATSEETIRCLETVIQKDPAPEVRERAFYALAEAPQNMGIPALINVAKSHPDKTIRKKAILWLGESKDPRAKEALLEIINEMK